jgi:hypothetical protein
MKNLVILCTSTRFSHDQCQAKSLRRYMKERKIVNEIGLFLTKYCHTVIYDNSIL